MNFTAEWISFDRTNAFSALANDYLLQHTALQSFYQHAPNLKGVETALRERESFPTDRTTLVEVLKAQYQGIATSDKVNINIEKLAAPNTFTICTAHQPNLFTGYLYFIYKIIHAIKIAEELNAQIPEKQFVPVYYMGSEDNDLAELNHIFLNQDKLVWETNQTGSVGQMQTKGLDVLIDRIRGELGVFEHGQSLVELLQNCYCQSPTIQEATFKFVNALFSSYGLIVLIADNKALKKIMTKVFEDDLFNHTPAKIVTQTAQQLAGKYHAQVHPRDINLFYMKDNLRERIINTGHHFEINHTDIIFTPGEMAEELNTHPERFSPNVVLRGLFQETILPNIVFVGGGSEIAYWLELKEMFTHYQVPYPVILLRNSFLIIEKKEVQLMNKLALSEEALFKEESALMNEIVKDLSSRQLTLKKEMDELNALYMHIESIAGEVDSTLIKHVKALESKSSKNLKALEKKLLRAEKNKFEVQRIQLHKLKSRLFPHNSLQERTDNVLPYYARFGQPFIDMLYKHAPTFNNKFGILKES